MDLLLGDLAIDIIKSLQSLNDILPFLNLFFSIITELGNTLLYIVLLAIIYWIFSKKQGIRLAFLAVFTSYITHLVKGFFGVPRPFEVSGEVEKLAEEASYSFFSGHSSSVGAFWGYLALYTKNKLVIGVSILLILLVPLSRVYLAVHWPTDVIVGVLVGLLLAYIVYRYSDAVEERLKSFSDIQLLIFSVLLSLTLAIISVIVPVIASNDPLRAATTDMTGALAGFAIGFILERKTSNFASIDFKSEDWKIKAVLRVVIGLILVLGVYFILKIFFDSFEESELQLVTDYIRYLLVAFTGAFICPYLFVRLKI